MRFSESLKVGLQALRANKTRSLVTALGIIVGVAAVECTISIGSGAQEEISERMRSLGANLLVVRPGARDSSGVRLEAGSQHTLTDQDASAISRHLADVQLAAPLISRQLQVVAANRNWATLVAGINSDYLLTREWQLKEGRPFDRADIDSGAENAIIGADIAEHLFGDGPAVGQAIRIGRDRFSVIAVLVKKGLGAAGRSQDDVVFVPLPTARSRLVGASRGVSREALDLISIKVRGSDAIPEVKDELETLLRRRHQLRDDTADDFIIENPADVLTARANATRSLSLLLVSVAFVSLVVGGIGVMNIMLVAIGERTREIGVRMAVGARRRDIVQQILVETIVLTFAGGIAGSLLGICAAVGAEWYAGWRVGISAAAVLLGCGLAGVVGTFFGLYPAFHAARLDPMTALRRE